MMLNTIQATDKKPTNSTGAEKIWKEVAASDFTNVLTTHSTAYDGTITVV